MSNLLAKAVLLPMIFGASVRADVVFSNVTGTGTVTGSNIVCGASSCGGLGFAEEFTPAANYSLTDAQMLVLRFSSPDRTFDVFLYSNNSGVPGSSIEQIGFGLTATTAYPGSLITANTVSTPITLLAGTPYWLVLTPHDANSFIGWSNGGSPAVPYAASLTGGANWVAEGNLTDQFQIDGTSLAAVPEPSSFVVLGIATLWFGIKRLR